MAPKKVTAAASQKKAAAGPSHASYKDMIKEAILTLKERNGSSRPAIKKYIQANNKIPAVSSAAFDSQFNKAIRTGVDKGDFEQPKGSSGTIKLAKKTASEKPATDKKPAAPKKAAAAKSPGRPKKTTTDDAPAPKKTASKAKAAAPKKAPATKKAAAPKPKANIASKRKTPAAAPAIVEQEKVLGKTKSGRVTKGPAKAAGPAKKAAPKKAAAAKKSATPKKKAEAAAAAT